MCSYGLLLQRKPIALIIALLFSFICIGANGQPMDFVYDSLPSLLYTSDADTEIYEEVDIFLIISSFNPDTRRTTDFINRFGSLMASAYPDKHQILVEDMGVRNFTEEAHTWKKQVEYLLSKYKGRNLKGVITIGQEAWAALAAQDCQMKGTLVAGISLSTNGIELPMSAGESMSDPVWTDNTAKLCDSSFRAGIASKYSVEKNIELILSLFPNTKNIFVLSDNTYGGVSLKTHFIRNIHLLPKLNYNFIDSRNHYLPHIKQMIREIPDSSALLIATWRVNRDGQYYMANSLDELLDINPALPAFSITGTGIGNGAIGGYIPNYTTNPQIIVNQILKFMEYGGDSLNFHILDNSYIFDQQAMEKHGVSPGNLPSTYRFTTPVDPRVEQYRYYLYIISAVALIFAVFVVAMTILYTRNKKLKQNLEIRTLQLIEAKNMAEESDRLKTAFLANMSHEIRTPLNAIVGFSHLLSAEEFAEEQRIEISKIITQNSSLLLTLITDILDISGLETGKLNFIFKETDVNSICKQVTATASAVKKEGVDIIFNPGAESIVFTTDTHRLSQVLLNLITNAIKFTEKGKIEVSCTVEQENSSSQEKQLLFCVTDTGPGIPEQHQSKLFERFGKLNSFKQGAGLGLAISKEIVTRLGGKIWLDTNYKNGARFYFTHPLK